MAKLIKSIKNFKQKILFKIYYRNPSIYNHKPFNNKFKLRGNSLVCKSLLTKCTFDINGKNNKIIIEEGCNLNKCKFIVQGNSNTVYIKKNTHARYAEFYIEDDNNSICVDEATYFAGKIHLACIEGCTITIGKDCLFSSEIVIRTGDSHSITDLSGNRINQSKNVQIGDHVWVGHKVSINKGVKIASNSVVGTGAIVTREFNNGNVVIAGNPAKTVKENINWDSKRI